MEEMKPNLKQLTNLELFELYADIMTELRQRNIIHSSNNPIANYAEKLAAKALSLDVMVESTKGYDATDQDGRRYEIKGRRPTVENKSRQLSMVRELDKKHFDFLVGIIFHVNFIVFKACIIPYEVVMQKAKYRKHSNAWIFQLKDEVWKIPGVRDVTHEIKEAQMI
jgi:hypothetical protein